MNNNPMNTDSLLRHYEKELNYLKQSGQAFAERHPKIASRLRSNGDTVEDPHVSRLIESFAFLNARIQQRLDDDLPEITDAMLNTLYPHYTKPIPAMTIAELQPQAELEQRVTIPKQTQLATDAVQGESCLFKTTYDTDIHPFSIKEVALISAPLSTPGANRIRGAESCLQIKLRGLSEKGSIYSSDLKQLRFYLGFDKKIGYQLYEWLLNRCQKIVVTTEQSADPNRQPLFLNPQQIKPVGFEADEGLLPYSAHSSLEYRLITEFFIFPEKFLFLDLVDLDKQLNTTELDNIELDHIELGNEINLYFYLEGVDHDVERRLSAQHIKLGCTPVINLFEQSAEPIAHTHHTYDYPVIPDARAKQPIEIYAINKVTSIDSNKGHHQEYFPFYGLKYQQVAPSQTTTQPTTFWHAQRTEGVDHKGRPTTAMSIALTDLNLTNQTPTGESIAVETTCFNGNTPNKLPFGGRPLTLTPTDSEIPAAMIHCLHPPTEAIYPALGNRARWKLIAHLNLNQMNLTGHDGLSVLKTILELYEHTGAQSHKHMINAIESMNAQPNAAPISVHGRTVVCRGTDISLTLNPNHLSGHSPYLFLSILERFFALSASINTYTRLTANYSGNHTFVKKWKPRVGTVPLL